MYSIPNLALVTYHVHKNTVIHRCLLLIHFSLLCSSPTVKRSFPSISPVSVPYISSYSPSFFFVTQIISFPYVFIYLCRYLSLFFFVSYLASFPSCFPLSSSPMFINTNFQHSCFGVWSLPLLYILCILHSFLVFHFFYVPSSFLSSLNSFLNHFLLYSLHSVHTLFFVLPLFPLLTFP